MEGNIRIYRLPKLEAREISVSRFVPWPKGSLSILILHSITITIVFIALKTRISHTQYKCTDIDRSISASKSVSQN